MIELDSSDIQVDMIDFGRKGKVLFQLPVLGSRGVPMGITSSFALFWEKYSNGQTLTEREVASSWNFFIQSLADSYPDATRQLARLDEAGLKQVITEWVRQSDSFDPKAPRS